MYVELEHAQLAIALLDVADRCGQQKHTICGVRGSCLAPFLTFLQNLSLIMMPRSRVWTVTTTTIIK